MEDEEHLCFILPHTYTSKHMYKNALSGVGTCVCSCVMQANVHMHMEDQSCLEVSFLINLLYLLIRFLPASLLWLISCVHLLNAAITQKAPYCLSFGGLWESNPGPHTCAFLAAPAHVQIKQMPFWKRALL